MPLQTIAFDDLVQQMVAELTSNTSGITNVTPGSVSLALMKAAAGAGMSLQQLIAYIYSTERLATCQSYADAVSFVGDYGMAPIPAFSALGALTCSRTITGAEQLVQVGSLVQTKINSIQFAVVADATQSAWDPVRSVYVFSPLVNSIAITVQATPAFTGSIGNVAIGTATQIISGFSGVNSVTNAQAFVSGSDAETLAAIKARFPLYLKSLKTSNVASVQNAIQGVQAGLSYQIIQYLKFDGAAFPSGFTVVVDDGSGNASLQFLNAVYAAVDAIRAAGNQFAVAKPTNVPIAITVTGLTVTPGSSAALVQQNIINALTLLVNKYGVGFPARIADVAATTTAVPGTYAYTSITINGSALDAAITTTQLARISSVTFA